LASVYVWQGAYQKAEAILAETLAAAEAARGPDDLTTLWSVYQLGVLYMNWGRHSDQVEGLLSRAYRGYVQIGGENHLGALGSLAALGVHAKRSGRLDQAERDFTRALAGRRAVLGDDHPYTIECYGLIGVVLAMQGQYDAAEPYLRQTLAGRRAVLGDDHPMTIESMAELGHLYQCQGQYTAAEPLLTRSLARSREVYGSYHVRTLNTLLLLAKLYLAMGRYAAAEPLYAELLAVLEGIGHRDYAFFATQSEFGEALLGQKKYSAAEPVLLSGYRGMLGQSDQTLTAEQKRDLLTAANRLARHYDGLGKPAEARRWRDTAAGYREIAPPPRPAKD
jgi:tetratricopeptide (TPR) repeat protein